MREIAYGASPLFDLIERDGDRAVVMELWLFVLLAAIIVVLGTLLWSVKRRANPRVSITTEISLDDSVHAAAALTYGGLREGNTVELLANGDGLYPRLFRDLEEARASIHFETYLYRPGELANRINTILAARARDGVKVRLLVDANGGRPLRGKELEPLTAAGCEVVKYHAFHLRNLGRINNRDHRKIVVIDGKTGYAGGHCVVDNWLGNAEDKDHYRDLTVRVTGPIVADLQSAFCENWMEETGTVLAGPDVFPQTEKTGTRTAHASFVTPAGAQSSVELLHYMMIEAAREQILIQNPYFLPDPRGIEALDRAVKRGVRVRVMLPAAAVSDAPIVQHASHHRFGAMLEAGVEILEYQRTLLHQKVITIDHRWSAIGSTNFDDRSFEVNDEIMIGVHDEEFAHELERVFEEDAKESTPYELRAWKKRSLMHRLTDFSAYLINEQL